jgi:hypothetical protein
MHVKIMVGTSHYIRGDQNSNPRHITYLVKFLATGLLKKKSFEVLVNKYSSLWFNYVLPYLLSIQFKKKHDFV